MKAANTLPHVGEFIFRQLDDYRYHCVSGNFEGSPADFCEVYGIAVPDDCHNGITYRQALRELVNTVGIVLQDEDRQLVLDL